ncbi:hypothetical protein C0993_007599, partial [Termitomyces sp. T159_Od127]
AAQVTDDINKAISNGDLECTTLLLDEWASLFSTSLSVGFLGSAPIVTLLLSRGLDTEFYADALIAACCKSDYDLDVLQAFVDSGWDINSYLGYVGDLLALCLHSSPMVKWAIEHGADPNANCNSATLSALESAINNEDFESAEILIDMGGAQINNTNALKYAARSGYTNMIELLLAKGAEIDEIPRPEYACDLMLTRHNTGMGTALHQAAMTGQLDAVKLLLERGADPRLKNLVGKTALELAREEHHMMVADVLAAAESVV